MSEMNLWHRHGQSELPYHLPHYRWERGRHAKVRASALPMNGVSNCHSIFARQGRPDWYLTALHPDNLRTFGATTDTNSLKSSLIVDSELAPD